MIDILPHPAYTPAMAVIGVVLAAGKGARFSAAAPGAPPKLLTLVEGAPLIRRAVNSLLEGGVDRSVIVVAINDEPAIRSALDGLPVTFAINPNPGRGMFSSIQCGVAAHDAEDLYALLPGDMPYVRPETVAAVLSAAIRSGLTACPIREGRRGHPLVFSAALRDRILEAPANAILSDVRSRDSFLSVEVSDDGIHHDVDRPEDLLR
jgi:molybdenum cofactor cytidylyltransferase